MYEKGVSVTTKTDDIRFTVPLYSVTEAAGILGVRPSTFSSWVGRGKQFRSNSGVTAPSAVVTSLETRGRQPTIPFVGLAEGLVLAAVRSAGVPMQRVRPALAALSKDLGIEHALASERLFTDGAELLFDHAKSEDSDAGRVVRELTVIRSGQRVFSEIVEQYLKLISYGDDGYATLIKVPGYRHAEVIVDPERSFGQPILKHGASPLSAILGRFWAGEDLKSLAEDFGADVAELEDVVRAASRRAA